MNRFEEEVLALLKARDKRQELEHLKYMAAIDNLNTNIAALATAVAALPQAGAVTGGATEAQVQSAADAVAAQTAIIVAKETPAVAAPGA